MRGTDSNGFRPIANPYIVGNPIKDAQMFFGREDDFTYVNKKFSTTKEGGMIVLCGARRSGKTSILFQIMQGRLGSDFLPVLIDMQSMTIRNDQDFLAKLGHQILSSVDVGVSIPRFMVQVESNAFAAVEDLVKRINAEHGGKRLIFMFDEYELFETNIDSGIITTRILNLLANLIEHKQVFVIFTGSDNLEARNKPYWDVFLSKALHRRISFLSEVDTLRLITEPLKGVVRFAENVPDRMYHLTAGQPFYTQVVCQSIVDRLNECRRYEVVDDDVTVAVKEIIENPLPQMIFNWNALKDLEKIGLAVIAELSKEKLGLAAPRDITRYMRDQNIGYRIDEGELSKALENLFHCDLLHKEGHKDAYSFKMDLWRSWVTRMHSVWQVIDEMERSATGPSSKGIIAEGGGRRRRLRLVLTAVGALVIMLPVAYWLLARGVSGPASEPRDAAIVSVETTPSDANVLVDGKWIGKSPVREVSVPAGSRVIGVERDGYEAVSDTLVFRKNEPKGLSYYLTERVGNLEVSSEPDRAEIYIDGKNTDKTTPAVITGLSARTPHQVELRLAGYQAKRWENVLIPEDSTAALNHSFAKMTGTMTIVSEPPEAQVYLDGKPIDTTPCILKDLPYGTHRLGLSKAGYRSHEEETDVSSLSYEKKIKLTVLPPGKIVFNIEPYGDVFINGSLVGQEVTYHEEARAPGKYTVLLKHPQFGTYTQEVEVKSDELVTVQHKFSSSGAGR